MVEEEHVDGDYNHYIAAVVAVVDYNDVTEKKKEEGVVVVVVVSMQRVMDRLNLSIDSAWSDYVQKLALLMLMLILWDISGCWNEQVGGDMLRLKQLDDDDSM